MSAFCNQSGRWWDVCAWPFPLSHVAFGSTSQMLHLSVVQDSGPHMVSFPWFLLSRLYIRWKCWFYLNQKFSCIRLISSWVYRDIIGVFSLVGYYFISASPVNYQIIFLRIYFCHSSTHPQAFNLVFLKHQIRQFRCVDIWSQDILACV